MTSEVEVELIILDILIATDRMLPFKSATVQRDIWDTHCLEGTA